MKHTFEGGITAESHDILGDQFLAGMLRDQSGDDAKESAQLRAAEVRHEREMKRAIHIITALVQKAGGSVDITDIEDALAYDLIVYRDESSNRQILKVRKP